MTEEKIIEFQNGFNTAFIRAAYNFSFALFRYFCKRYSDNVDIIPINWYIYSKIGGIVFVHDSKTGF